VLEVHEDSCLVDTNHPLAGEDLRFDVTVLEVRAATDQEIESAEHALGPDVELGTDLIMLGRKPRERSQPS
jgi:FKBP-type peptidyl-prolyl cis-trans isomerase SlyD